MRKGRIRKEGQVELTGREQMTFWDLALSEYAADSGISENDWYHAAVAYFHDCEAASGVLDFWVYGLDLSELLMQWYEYEISIGPGERLVNTVTAPLYPDINRDSFPALYRYSYLLSPARTWKASERWMWKFTRLMRCRRVSRRISGRKKAATDWSCQACRKVSWNLCCILRRNRRRNRRQAESRVLCFGSCRSVSVLLSERLQFFWCFSG